VILLDLMLPGLDGVGVCRAVRTLSDAPIIMVTARVDELDRIWGLKPARTTMCANPLAPARSWLASRPSYGASMARYSATPCLG
jgi:DNA-binding response OmpR family regulator